MNTDYSVEYKKNRGNYPEEISAVKIIKKASSGKGKGFHEFYQKRFASGSAPLRFPVKVWSAEQNPVPGSHTPRLHGF